MGKVLQRGRRGKQGRFCAAGILLEKKTSGRRDKGLELQEGREKQTGGYRA